MGKPLTACIETGNCQVDAIGEPDYMERMAYEYNHDTKENKPLFPLGVVLIQFPQSWNIV